MSSVNQVGVSGMVSMAAASGALPQANAPGKIRGAAQQFEALLLGQILHSAHDADSGWLGSGGDSSSGCATDFAEEQLASTMAQQGGLGLAKMITEGLQRESSTRQTP
ncbi:MAG TPA: rod-binding protein [Bryobacteraceae bacterium]|jgi:Rod binding domain-containing protein|nr:rod-binding protein [Bryobacteraceae bacterium]